jgi:hypothetical protein
MEFLESNFKGQTHWIENFLISLKISWDVDIKNGLAWPIWVLITQVMAEIKVDIQSTNLIPNH